jgi:WD40 repeat protein
MTTQSPVAAAPRAVDRENPWPGLAAFEEGDHDFFKGREEEISGLLKRIYREDLTLLWGFSGLGKTSLLRAGLFPQLREADIFPVYVRLRYAEPGAAQTSDTPATLSEQVFEAVREAAERWHYELPSRPASGSIWEFVRRRTERFWGPGDRLVTPLLVFDQFEELFTRDRGSGPSESALTAFFQDLSDAMTGSPPQWLLDSGQQGDEHGDYLYRPGVFKILLSFREDFLAQVAGFRALVQAIDSNYYRLESMTVEQGLAVVAGAGGHLIDDSSPGEKDAICRRIVERASPAAAKAPATVDPALLSLVCRELNEARRVQHRPVIDREIVESPAASQIISGFYDERMGEVAESTRRFVEERLVIPESRSRESVAEVIATSSGAVRGDLDFLIEKRILRREDTRHGQPRLELTHDVLVEPALAARARRALEEQQRTADQARREQAEREREAEAREHEARELALVRQQVAQAKELAEARDKAEQEARARRAADAAREAAVRARLEHEVEIEAERGRVKASLARSRKGWMGVLAAVALGALVTARSAVRENVEHRARRLSEAANAQLSFDPQLSTMLSVRAVEEARAHGGGVVSVAEAALFRSVREASRLGGSFRWSGTSLAISPDGTRLALLEKYGRGVEVRDGPVFGNVAARIQPHKDKQVIAVHFTADNRGVLLVSSDLSFERIDDVARPEVRTRVAGPDAADSPGRAAGDVSPARTVKEQAFDRDRGRLLVVSSYATEYLKSPAGYLTSPNGSPQEPPDQPNRLPSVRWWVSTADVHGGAWDDVPLNSSDLSEVVLSRDGERYATMTREGLATVLEADGREVRRHLFSAGDTLRMNAQGSRAMVLDQRTTAATIWAVAQDKTWSLPLPGRGEIVDAVFSPDGRAVAVVQASEIAQVWDLDTQRSVLDAPLPARGVAFSPDSKEFLSWDDRNVVQLSSLSSEQQPLRFTGQQEVIVGAAMAPAGGPVVTVSGSQARVWSRTPVDTIAKRANDKRVDVIALSPDGQSVASTDGRVLTLSDQPPLAPPVMPGDEVMALAYSQDGGVLAVGLSSGEIVFRARAGGASPMRPLRDRRGAITALAFGPRGTVMAYVVRPPHERNIAVLIDRQNEVRLGEHATDGQIVAVTVSQDERRYAVGVLTPARYWGSAVEISEPGVSFQIFDRDAPVAPEVPRSAPLADTPPQTDKPAPADFQPDGFQPENRGVVPAVAGISADLAFAVSTNRARQVTPWLGGGPQPALTFDEEVRVVAVAPDGRHFAAGGEHGLTALYAANGPTEPLILQARGLPVTALAFSATGEHVACARNDGSVTVYSFGIDALLGRAASLGVRRQPTKEECRALGDLCWSNDPWSLRRRFQSFVTRLAMK